MRKLISILAILAAVMLTPSCQKELPDAIKNIDVSQGGQTPASPEISLDMNNIEFTAESGSKAFNIKSNTSWAVSSNQAWCSVSPASGKNNGSVTVKVSENTQTSARTATVTVKSEIGILTVKVTQNEANAAISLDTSTMEFTSSSGEQAFKITANTSWAVSSDQTWCSVSPSSGKNNGSVTVKVSENTQTSARTATITVKTDAGIRTVSVTQNGASEQVSLSVSDMEFTSGSGSKIFSIKSNTAWAVSSDKNWCSVSPTSGSGDGSVTVSVDENTSTSSRTATITVESATIKRTLAVTQNGVTPTPTPTPETPIANQVVGSYSGTEVLTVMGEADESTKTIEFTKATDVSVDVTLPQYGEGMATVPALPVKGIALTKSGNTITGKLDKYEGTVKSADGSEKAYTVSDFTVIFNDKTVVVTFTQKYGNMPFFFEGLFTGTKEK